MGLHKGRSKAGPLTAGQRVGILCALLMFTAHALTLQSWDVFSSLGRPEVQPGSATGPTSGWLCIPNDFARHEFERHKREEAQK